MEYDVGFVGLGYVGLSTAVCFSNRRMKVLGIEIDTNKISQIRKAKTPIHEKDMSELLKKAIDKNNLVVSSDYNELQKTRIIFLTVGTPSTKTGSIDVRYIRQATKEIAKIIKSIDEYFLIVVKSTVVPGTSNNIIKKDLEKYSNKKSGKHFGIVANPEFLQEGKAIHDTFYPDRLVIGADSKKELIMIKNLYKKFYRQLPPVIKTSLVNAELIKYSNNSFLATKISFMNYIARIAEEIPGADVNDIKNALGLDKRISDSFLNAGLGFGGSCFPKDVRALIAFSESVRVESDILKSVMRINNTQFLQIISLLRNKLGTINNKKISILGLSFKPNTDDIREATSIKIIEKLLKHGAKITVYDPVAIPNIKQIFGTSIKYTKNARSCLKSSECCLLVTEWEEFKKLNNDDIVKLMKNPLIIDGRRLFSKNHFKKPVEYYAIGLG